MVLWIIVAVVFVVVLWVAIRNAMKSLAAYHRVVAREGLELTETPLGLTASDLVELDLCPAGGRRHGLQHAATGTMTVEVGGRAVEAEVAAFRWWWEEHHEERDGDGNGQWTEQDHPVAVLRLPTAVPHVTITPEGRLARWGIGGREDVQVESEEFNRRFDVADHDTDRALVVRLLSPDFQRILAEHYDGRSIELRGDLLVVAGDSSRQPPQDEPDLEGTVVHLPGARHDAVHLASALPTSFLRALDGAAGEPPTA